MERLFSPKVFEDFIEDSKDRQKELNYIGDISDMGNEIGVLVGTRYPNMNPVEIENFISGFKHGVSLTNGTH
jgi:hypothetical protein